MSKPGYPYDNSCMESFFASMKKEYILRKEYDQMSSLSKDLFYYIEIFHNRKRLHSTLGYCEVRRLSIEHEIVKWWENEDAIKKNRKLIRQKLKNCLKTNGYRQGRCSCFYQFYTDYVVYYKLEHPSIMTYLWLCIYPLYMPPGDLRVFSFGDRLSSLTDNYVWDIRDYESEGSIDEWCRRITDIDNTYVASLIKQISTISSAERLLDCNLQSESGENLSSASFICLGAEKINCLKMFTKLALHKYDEASRIANSTLQAGVDGSLRVNQNLMENCKRVIDLAFIRDDNYVDSTINIWRETNTKRFICK